MNHLEIQNKAYLLSLRQHLGGCGRVVTASGWESKGQRSSPSTSRQPLTPVCLKQQTFQTRVCLLFYLWLHFNTQKAKSHLLNLFLAMLFSYQLLVISTWNVMLCWLKEAALWMNQCLLENPFQSQRLCYNRFNYIRCNYNYIHLSNKQISIPEEDNELFKYDLQRQFVVFCGTEVMQAKAQNGNYCKAVVVRTG